MVHFVGAGPGAPDLITVRGQKLLREADCIIYAGSLVNPELLSLKKEGAEVYNSAEMTLEEVFEVLKRVEAEGGTSVRLHTGDPSVYGAIREQMDLLDSCGISYDVCPGVSSFFAAAAALDLEYTLPGISQSVIITRAPGRTPVPEAESPASFAVHGATMVYFLSTGLAEKLRDELIAGGLAEETPAAVVYKASWPEQKTLRCTLKTLPEAVKELGVSNTALLIIGDVLDPAGKGERSKLYDPGFSTAFRTAAAEGKKAEGEDRTNE